MKILNLITITILIIFLGSCAGTGKITSLNETGNTSFQAGNYTEALKIWENEIISKEGKGKLADGSIYSNAGKVALKLKCEEISTGTTGSPLALGSL